MLPSRLEGSAPLARVSRATADALRDEPGSQPAQALLEGLSPGGYLLTGSYGTAALAKEEP